ncbi:hypothetical protein M1466_03190 [Candidatus Dependentiae bacterium]|nr:hypothetical protein [Candidatus Dependentiae bacterium]
MRYSALEVIPYQLILTAHQIALYAYLGPTAYGQFGMSFAFIYLIVAAGMGGFYQQLIRKPANFTETIEDIIIVHIVFVVSLLLCCYSIISSIPQVGSDCSPFYALRCMLDQQTFVVTGLIIIAEIIHRTGKLLLYRLHVNRIPALGEVVGILIYCGTVWGIYAFTGTISFQSIFLPLLCMAAANGIFYWFNLMRQLPCSWCNLWFNLMRQPQQLSKLLYERYTAAAYYCIINLWNSNSLILLLGAAYGKIPAIGNCKLATHYLALITAIIDHIAGMSLSLTLRVTAKDPMPLLVVALRIAALLGGTNLLLLLVGYPCIQLFCIPSASADYLPVMLFAMLCSIEQLTIPWLHIAYVNGSWPQYTLVAGAQLGAAAIAYTNNASITTLLAAMVAAKLISSILVITGQHQRTKKPA